MSVYMLNHSHPMPVQYVYAPQQLENMNCILEPSAGRGGLYLGDLMATTKTDELLNNNIGAILSVAIESKFNKASDSRLAHITDKHIQAFDVFNYDISQHFEECFDWIEKELQRGHSVLVHCRAGISRSASIVIAYLMKKRQMGFQEAYTFVKAKRNRVEPNFGFKDLLRKYETTIRVADNSMGLDLSSSQLASGSDLKSSKMFTHGQIHQDTKNKVPVSLSIQSLAQTRDVKVYSSPNPEQSMGKASISHPPVSSHPYSFTSRPKTPLLRSTLLSGQTQNFIQPQPERNSLNRLDKSIILESFVASNKPLNTPLNTPQKVVYVPSHQQRSAPLGVTPQPSLNRGTVPSLSIPRNVKGGLVDWLGWFHE